MIRKYTSAGNLSPGRVPEWKCRHHLFYRQILKNKTWKLLRHLVANLNSFIQQNYQVNFTSEYY